MGALIRLVDRTPVPEPCAPPGDQEPATSSSADAACGSTGRWSDLAPAPLLLLRALLGAGGAVLSREALSDLLDLRGSVHALDMTVSRLRSSLPDGKLVETVVKRGYRIRV